MNEYKIMCEISFPKFDRILDVALPVNKTVYYVCKMLDKIIQDEFATKYKPSEQSLLVNKRSGKVYDKNVLLKATDICNGAKLVYY